MKRAPSLRGLSEQHHHALVLARSLAALCRSGKADAAAARSLADRFAREIEPHFAVEDEVLVPALARAGERDLVQRVERDHALLRAIAAEANEGEFGRLALFAEQMTEHVRFEERVLFPRCEVVLDDAVLNEVARRAPKEG